MFKQKYQKLYNGIQAPQGLVDRVLAQADEPVKGRRPGRLVRIGVVAAVLCCMAAVPALAVRTDNGYSMLYQISPAVAQFFKPVQRTCVDNGIQMEVISANVSGDTANIYLSLQDLTGDRVDASTDLFDSYSINTPFDSVNGCQQVGYDPLTKTATFLITTTQTQGKNIVGDKITFSVREFLSGKQSYEAISIPFSMEQVTQEQPTQIVSISGGGGRKNLPDTEEVLVPGQPLPNFPVDGIAITAMGFLDGKLHVQAQYGDITKTDNHGSFYLQDGAGNQIKTTYNAYFNQQINGERVDYCEFVFDSAPEELKNCQLYGDFVVSKQLTQGKWQVTFPIE